MGIGQGKLLGNHRWPFLESRTWAPSKQSHFLHHLFVGEKMLMHATLLLAHTSSFFHWIFIMIHRFLTLQVPIWQMTTSTFNHSFNPLQNKALPHLTSSILDGDKKWFLPFAAPKNSKDPKWNAPHWPARRNAESPHCDAQSIRGLPGSWKKKAMTDPGVQHLWYREIYGIWWDIVI